MPLAAAVPGIPTTSAGEIPGIPGGNSSQGCSLGLERLGLETVSRRFLERLGLVSVLKVERLGLVSVLRVWKNRTSRSRLGLEGSTSRSRLGLEDITSRSRSRGFVTLGLVNIGATHQAFGYIRKKIMDLTMRPARNRLASERLDQLVFLKCNSLLSTKT